MTLLNAYDGRRWYFLSSQKNTPTDYSTPLQRINSWEGVLSVKFTWGYAPNMGSKISLLVYKGPLIKCNIRSKAFGVWIGWLPKFQSKIHSILISENKKIGWNLAQNWSLCIRMGVCMGTFSNSHGYISTMIELEYLLIGIIFSPSNFWTETDSFIP